MTYGPWAPRTTNLPGFVVLIVQRRVRPQRRQEFLLAAGFLPSVLPGRAMYAPRRGPGPLSFPIPQGIAIAPTVGGSHSTRMRRPERACKPATSTATPKRSTRIAQYELAFRMQTSSVPRTLDVTLARRAASRARRLRGQAGARGQFGRTTACSPGGWSSSGVRFVQLFDWGWDFHGSKLERRHLRLRDGLTNKCQPPWTSPVAALLKDLRRARPVG